VVLADVPAAAPGRALAPPSLSAANGQLLAVRRSTYERAGGHARRPRRGRRGRRPAAGGQRAGGLGGVCDGTGLAVTRMYDTWDELAAGYGKSLWTLPLPALAVLGGVYLVPPLAALRGSRAGCWGTRAGVAGRVVAARRTGLPPSTRWPTRCRWRCSPGWPCGPGSPGAAAR
jgi:hypothetical protein